MNGTQLDAMKQNMRATWAAGDYATVARRDLWEVGERVVTRVGVQPGENVLDVACGTGNAAIRAAQAEGVVTGVDLTPELFEAGRREAAEAGVEIDWVEGDAEDLPFGDESFDVVTSTFGCMFAPRHAIAASEIARVLRPGGRIAITAWRPEGAIGAMFRTMGGYMPPAPDFVQPPGLWGTEAHVRDLFEGTGVQLEFDGGDVGRPGDRFDSAEEAVDWGAENFGPLMGARRMTEADGRWPQLRADLIRVYELDDVAEYLLTLGRRS